MNHRPALALSMLALCACTALAAPPRYVARVSQTGRVDLRADDGSWGHLTAGFAESGWRFHDLDEGREWQPITEEGRRIGSAGRIPLASGTTIEVESRFRREPGGFAVTYRLTPSADLAVESIHAAFGLPASLWAGAGWEAGDARGTIPTAVGPTQVYVGTGTPLALEAPAGHALRILPSAESHVLLQDSRQWGPSLDVRIGAGAGTRKAGETYEVTLQVAFGPEVELVFDEPVVLSASAEWIPLTTSLDIAPGSALDWSDQGLCAAPAGARGPLVVGPTGRFELAGRPGEPMRLWGVNLCFGALYPDHPLADRVATRLRMLGYNAVRIHHYEGGLIEGGRSDSVTLNPDALDRLDYLIAALKREGLYITTDGFVSRPVRAAEVFPGRTGDIPMDTFKMLALVDDRAFACWCDFLRAWLTHVNPYTGLALADDPVLAGLALINEGNAGNFIENLDELARPAWSERYNAWLLARYGGREGLARAWGSALATEEDPARGAVGLHRGDGRRAADLGVFWATVERDAYARMSRFLRDELGVDTPLTDMNSWTDTLATQAVRGDYDFVDGHYYWDHPSFLERPWSLPARGWSNGESMVSAGGAGARDRTLLRLYGKPFTITEFNSPAPNRYRAECGLLMGAVAGLQGWDAVYRFAYSHDAGNLGEPRPSNFFDLASDPLNLAADRAAILLFLRGDLAQAPHRIAVRMDPGYALGTPDALPSPEFALRELTYVTGLGMRLGEGEEDLAFAATPGVSAKGLTEPPGSPEALAVAVRVLRERGWLPEGNPTDPGAGILASETGEVVLNAPAGTLSIGTPRFAGVFSRRPGTAVEAGSLEVALDEVGGTVWLASLDGAPIARSRRLLLVHLTEVQNTGARFRENDRLTLEAWGGLPYLARNGAARVRIARDADAAPLRCWALGADGARAEALEVSEAAMGAVDVGVSVAGPAGARLYYELAAE